MARRERIQEVFVELINLQLEPHGKTYEDVKKDPDWYMNYSTTRESEKMFVSTGTKIIREKLRMSKKLAEMEMSWFILQWGLTTKSDLKSLEKEVIELQQKPKKTRAKK
jgi:hypothetical protein|tara:strand:+ start:1475 stop:1801 length:327 start_codon:yes stop_codon:yes gene_type:complete